jgi:hypothetical protein
MFYLWKHINHQNPIIMKNQVYIKVKNNWKELKEFPNGQLDEAMSYGYKLAYADRKKTYAVCTEDGKFLKLNTVIIV